MPTRILGRSRTWKEGATARKDAKKGTENRQDSERVANEFKVGSVKKFESTVTDGVEFSSIVAENIGLLKKSIYGTRDAASNWE